MGMGHNQHDSDVLGHHHHLTEVVVDRRGLTAAGAVSIALAMGLLGGILDVASGSGLGSAFAVLFTLGCILAAAVAHREDLRATIVLPPLVYVTVAFVAAALQQTTTTGSWLKQQTLELTTSLVLGAPVLITATAAAAAVAVIRAMRAKKARGPASGRRG